MIAPRTFAMAGLGLTIFGVVGTAIVRYLFPAPFISVAFGFGGAAMVGFLIQGLSWASIGALLVVRRPENAVGWLMVLVGVGNVLSQLSVAIAFAFAAEGTAQGERLAQIAGWVTVLLQLVGVFQIAIGFLFPTGRPQSHRWARFLRLYLAFAIVFVVISLTQPGPLQLIPALQNPFGIGPDLRGDRPIAPILAIPTLIVLTGLGTSMVTRYRSAERVERQQLKWFALALGLSASALGVLYLEAALMNSPAGAIGLTVYVFAGALVPVGIGIAILRHHLYDIDRLISRTLGYGVVTGLLAVVFTGTILVLQNALITFTQGRGIAVAFSTLLVFALFQPVRRRVQAGIDRRFDRARYDAEHTVETFAARLRDDIDLGTVRAEILATTASAVRPTQATLWIRGAPQ